MKMERAMSKRAFMKVTGFSFPTVQELWSDFVAWRRRGLRSPRPKMQLRPELGACHTRIESVPRNDSPVALPPRVARLRASLV